MGRSGNRLSNRPAAAPTQVKKMMRLPPGNTDSHNQSADCLHRRVSRFPATLWRENRDTSSKPPRFIHHRRRFGGFRQKPMVFGFPFPSRVSFVMGRSGNRLSNRPAAAPTQAKKILRLPPGNTDSHNQSADCLHRRVNRFPTTLWHENRDTFLKPSRCIRHRRHFGGFLGMTVRLGR